MSPFNRIIDNISKHISLSKAESDFLLSKLQFKSFPKKSLIQEAGKPCASIYFVNTGALRAFFQGSDGKECTIMFAVADWWITDMNSFINGTPAMVNIEAIDDCSIVKLNKSDLDLFFIEIPAFEKLFRILMQNAYIREQLRTIQNLSLPAEERYQNFLAKYPQFAKQITQKQIASYLGITPEFLSAIRKNLSKGKKT